MLFRSDFLKGDLTGAALTTAAFTHAIGSMGSWIVSIGIILFAYSTILGWAYYGEKCATYLCGIKVLLPYRIIFVAFVAIGACLKLAFVWDFADTMNGLMAIPNLIGLLLLSKVVVAETEDFFATKYKDEKSNEEKAA